MLYSWKSLYNSSSDGNTIWLDAVHEMIIPYSIEYINDYKPPAFLHRAIQHIYTSTASSPLCQAKLQPTSIPRSSFLLPTPSRTPKRLHQPLRFLRTHPSLQHLMRTIHYVILNPILVIPALRKRQPGQRDQEFLLAAWHDAEFRLHVYEMGVILGEVEEQARSGVHESGVVGVGVGEGVEGV